MRCVIICNFVFDVVDRKLNCVQNVSRKFGFYAKSAFFYCFGINKDTLKFEKTISK